MVARLLPLESEMVDALPLEPHPAWATPGRAPAAVLQEFLMDARCGGAAALRGRRTGAQIVGYVLFGHFSAFAAVLPRGLPAPETGDIYIAGLRVRAGMEGEGIGKLLCTGVFREAVRRRYSGVAATAGTPWTPESPWLPAPFLERVGLRLERPHAQYPLYRCATRGLSPVRELLDAVERLAARARTRGVRPAWE